jgi:hypothetical protein
MDRSLTINLTALQDTRIILTMSNIRHLQTKLLPTMLTKFEALYGLKSVDDKDMLQQIIGQVDEVLFEDYLKRKRETLQQITDAGLLGPGVDPLAEVRPKGEHVLFHKWPGRTREPDLRYFSCRRPTLHAQRSLVLGGCACACHHTRPCLDATRH